MTNPSNISANPRFSVLEFARVNSPRGQILFSSQTWDENSSAPLVLQPPNNTSAAEMFFVKEVNLLVKQNSGLGPNNKFQIFQQCLNPSVILEASSVIELHNYFDIDNASPIQNPEFPTDTTEIYNKLVFTFLTPAQIRSSVGDKFEIKITDSVDQTVLSGISTGGLIHVSILGWRILENTF